MTRLSLNADLHIHSNHSCDAKATIDEMCQAAMDKGLDQICFTEHFDMNPKDEGYNYYDHETYTKDIQHAREKYSTRLTILQGIEFGEPHLYPKEFEKLVRHGFDFVLGSIHWLGDDWIGDKDFQARYSVDRIFELHYAQTMQAIQFSGFDSIAHIDFPKRYLFKKHEPSDLIDSITNELVKRHIALEINTSPIRKGYAEIHPSDAIFEAYVKHGGVYVTVGSDAHRGEDIGRDFNLAIEKIVKYKLKVIGFVARKQMEIGAGEQVR
jgi:histidinol-phosphatase (PHP family)